ncbi:hypothetical protein B0H11DRAFT_1922387 [Mycena galericulata]|nr:hypothetical protein B0H11DRAFT_1922387 [Mycena galericulata]
MPNYLVLWPSQLPRLSPGTPRCLKPESVDPFSRACRLYQAGIDRVPPPLVLLASFRMHDAPLAGFGSSDDVAFHEVRIDQVGPPLVLLTAALVLRTTLACRYGRSPFCLVRSRVSSSLSLADLASFVCRGSYQLPPPLGTRRRLIDRVGPPLVLLAAFCVHDDYSAGVSSPDNHYLVVIPLSNFYANVPVSTQSVWSGVAGTSSNVWSGLQQHPTTSYSVASSSSIRFAYPARARRATSCPTVPIVISVMSSPVTWPFSIVAQIHMSPPGDPSLFAPSQSIRALVAGAGLSHVSIRFQNIQNSVSFTMLSVDTLDADIDRTTRSWSITTSSWECPRQLAQLPIRIELDFATIKQLDCFLLALSYVRFIDGRSSLAILSLSLAKAHEIVMVEDDESPVKTLSTHFVIMRTILGDKCSVHALPVELISLIFIHCTPSGRHRFEIPLLLLRICSRWRDIAVQTPELWRDPRFTLGPSFFRNRDNHHFQMASWLTRAKSSGIALALTVRNAPHLPDQTFNLAQDNPSFFSRVRTLRLSSSGSQLRHFFEGAALPVLQTLYLLIENGPAHLAVPFCQSAPLLRSVQIDNSQRLAPAPQFEAGFVTAFPWSQLTVLIIQTVIGISVWIPVFSQCTSLETGHFVVKKDYRRYRKTAVTFRNLISLRVTFRRICDTACFDHLTFPALELLHLAGVIPQTTLPHTSFIPQLTTLRALFLDVVGLPQPLLQTSIGLHPKLEQLGIYIDGVHTPDQYAAMFHPRGDPLRTLTISTLIEDRGEAEDLHVVASRATAWAVQQAFATATEFRLFGPAIILDAVLDALTQFDAVTATRELSCDEDRINSPYFPRRFLSVRRRLAEL